MNLFDESEITRCASAAVLRHRALMTFGAGPPAERLGIPFRASLPEALRDAWENLLAAEALLARRSGLPFPTSPKPDSRPCGSESPYFSELAGLPFGVTLFPLAASSGAPQVGRVWCFNLVNTRKRIPQSIIRLDGWTDFLSALPDRAALRFFFDLPAGAPVAGRSWQLAARLAAAFSARHLAPQARELAANWIVTGEIAAAGNVHPVKVGNKAQLLHSDRRWLYPAHSPGFDSLPGHAVSRLDEARAHIVNTPIQLPSEPWPSRIRFMHMLVGENTLAQEAAALIPDAIERIVLWHSENEERSLQPARKLRASIGAFRPAPAIDLEILSANSLIAIQETIAVRLLPDLEHATDRDPVYFNVTSGNKLMFFAVAMLAQHPRHFGKMRLIYRERDTPALTFIQIRYTPAGPETRELSLPNGFSPAKRKTVERLLTPPEKPKPACFTKSTPQKGHLT
ncbi:MAG: hypothetical protein R6X19_06915 [Kiritimatiellia bacterium]